MADIGIINVSDGEIAWVDLSSYASPLIVGLGFNKDSSQLLYQVQNRTQSSLHLGSYDLSNKQSAIIWSENSSTWVNRLQESYIFTDNGFYFLSERTGYAQIYFYSYQDEIAHQKTHENFEVKKIIHTSDDYVYFVANEKSLLEDQVYSLNLVDGKITRLLSADQHHEAEISANGLFMMATSQSHLRPPENLCPQRIDRDAHKQHSLQFAHKVQESGNTSLHQVLYLQNDHGLLGGRKHLFAMMARFIKANL